MNGFKKWLLTFTLVAMPATTLCGQQAETLPALQDGTAPDNFAKMWSGFDPRSEPLAVETLQQWEQDGVVLRIVRFHIGTFKGKPARLAAVYGFPKNIVGTDQRVPGLLQIHGGGQYADYQACLANAQRGYRDGLDRLGGPNQRAELSRFARRGAAVLGCKD